MKRAEGPNGPVIKFNKIEAALSGYTRIMLENVPVTVEEMRGRGAKDSDSSIITSPQRELEADYVDVALGGDTEDPRFTFKRFQRGTELVLLADELERRFRPLQPDSVESIVVPDSVDAVLHEWGETS